MQPIDEASRNYEDIQDKYFVLFVPPLIMNAPELFDSVQEAKRYLLRVMQRPDGDLKEYERLEHDIAATGGSLMILNVRQEVEKYEKANGYETGDFKDRQDFLNEIVFGGREE